MALNNYFPDSTKTLSIEERKQLQQMEVLLNISREVAAQQTLDAVLTSIVEVTTQGIGTERGSLFIHDEETHELYTRVALGNNHREIRIPDHIGVAGHVFTSGKGEIINDAYADPRFDQEVDKETNFITRNMLCVPVRTVTNQIIGILQILNKKEGPFTQEDLDFLEAMTSQVAITLKSTKTMEEMKKSREKEMIFLDIVSDITSELNLDAMLNKVMSEAAIMLRADRSTLFLHDEKNNELFSRVAMGNAIGEIRIPNNVGIAGTVFTTNQTINIPYAYADLRFNPAMDKQTGYFTRSILCVPVINKKGRTIGVTQVLNKKGGVFNKEDEIRLRAFTSQVSISLENAKLFEEMQNMKNYADSMLESMTNGVLTLDNEGIIVTCNASIQRILKTRSQDILNRPIKEVFSNKNAWVLDRIHKVEQSLQSDITMDAELIFREHTISVNLTVLPLMSSDKQKLGDMLLLEDISNEKRMKSTMSRYMDPALADQLLSGDENFLGGKNMSITMLFSDIRGFTSITEELGAQGTVTLLNEYFTIMVECIQKEGGMLDKFIGDAIMASFGLPMPHDDDEDRAVRTAIAMIRSLREWNKERVAHGKRPLDMGIGLNTGMVVSGNIGSPKRMDFTVIGDGVNLAARLESACKQYSARILISEYTYQKLRGTYRIREVDLVVVKGKSQPVAIYEVLDYHSTESFPNLMPVLNHFSAGITLYRQQEWDKSIQAFRSVLELHPEDHLAQIYVDRCNHMKNNPPGAEWDGIWIMASK
ncbi:MAG: GAF domain-containing protein [Magnetococcus sp. DMHC-6]